MSTRRRTFAGAAALASLLALLVPSSADAATVYKQNSMTAKVSGATVVLTAKVAAHPAKKVAAAGFCTQDATGAAVAVVQRPPLTIKKSGVTLTQTATLPAGTYTSVPCYRKKSSGSYHEIGKRKSFTITAPVPTPPNPSAKPGASNTGVPAGTVLTAYTGPLRITTPGTVIDGKDVTGGLVIEAKRVVVKNTRVHGTDEGTGIYTTGSGSATILDSEVSNFETGLTYGNFTAVRVDVHDMTYDGAKLSSNGTIRDSWIHAPRPGAGAHWDGIQVQDGVVNTTIAGNNIDGGTADINSALFLCPDLGPSTPGPLLVEGNWVNGGNFTVNVLDGANGKYFIGDITVRDNKFGRDHQYGYSNVNVPVAQSGNTDADGKPLDL